MTHLAAAALPHRPLPAASPPAHTHAQTLITAVAQVGVDVNAIAAHPWRAGPLAFVPGLGPRKARALLAAIASNDNHVKTRIELLKAADGSSHFGGGDVQQMGPTVSRRAHAHARMLLGAPAAHQQQQQQHAAALPARTHQQHARTHAHTDALALRLVRAARSGYRARPQVFRNAAPFLRVRRGEVAALQNEEEFDALDDARIHPENEALLQASAAQWRLLAAALAAAVAVVVAVLCTLWLAGQPLQWCWDVTLQKQKHPFTPSHTSHTSMQHPPHTCCRPIPASHLPPGHS